MPFSYSDIGTLVVLAATICGFLLPMVWVYPPVAPRPSDLLRETHSKLGEAGKKQKKKTQTKATEETQGPTIKNLFVYPIKSCRGIRVERSAVLPWGLEYDRMFTFAQLKSTFPARVGRFFGATDKEKEGNVDEDDEDDTWDFITQRQFPRLATLQVEVWLPDKAKTEKAQKRMRVDDWAQRASSTTQGYVVVRYAWRERGWEGWWATVGAKLTRGWRAEAEEEVVLPMGDASEEEEEEEEEVETKENLTTWMAKEKLNRERKEIEAKPRKERKEIEAKPRKEKKEIEAKPRKEGKEIEAKPRKEKKEIEAKPRKEKTQKVRIWGEVVEAVDLSAELPRSLQLYLGVSNKLGLFRVRSGNDHDDGSQDGLRKVFRCAPTADDAGYQPVTAFQDAYAVHLVGDASVAALAAAAGLPSTETEMETETESMTESMTEASVSDNTRRFRPNIEVTGFPPYDEDDWKQIVFRSPTTTAPFAVSCRTVRCTLPNVDPSTGVKDARGEPDKTLRAQRAIDKGAPRKGCLGMQLTPLFGQSLDKKKTTVEVGMQVEVLERGEHQYIAR